MNYNWEENLVEKQQRRKSPYCNFSLPWALIDAIDFIIHFHPELGYSSRSEFIKESCRIRILTIEDRKILRELEWIKHKKKP